MARCFFPYYAERQIYHHQQERYVPVPCGKCPECLKRRTQSWSHRLEHEAKRHQSQFFVTLTYDTMEVPISPNGFMTLDQSHVQKFFKRLRKSSGAHIRYYYCGEYGTENKRPHYHLIIFSDDHVSDSDITKAWINPDSNFLHGHVHFGTVESASIRYTVSYFDKGDWKPAHNRDDRVPEFSRMSKGIGSNLLTLEMFNWILMHPNDQYLYHSGGKKMAIPEYYKRRIFEHPQLTKFAARHPVYFLCHCILQYLKKERIKAAKKLQDEQEQPTNDRELHENRAAAILNYRRTKRKSRPT